MNITNLFTLMDQKPWYFHITHRSWHVVWRSANTSQIWIHFSTLYMIGSYIVHAMLLSMIMFLLNTGNQDTLKQNSNLISRCSDAKACWSVDGKLSLFISSAKKIPTFYKNVHVILGRRVRGMQPVVTLWGQPEVNVVCGNSRFLNNIKMEENGSCMTFNLVFVISYSVILFYFYISLYISVYINECQADWPPVWWIERTFISEVRAGSTAVKRWPRGGGVAPDTWTALCQAFGLFTSNRTCENISKMKSRTVAVYV